MNTTSKCAILLLILLSGLFRSGQMMAQSTAQVDLAAIDAYVQEQMARSSIPGLAYAIVQNGRIVHIRAFGVADPAGRPMTPQTPLYIGSVGKTFTALAIRQLANAGRLDPDAPVVEILPWFTLADDEAARRITIRHLLEHTSGLSEQDGNDPLFYRPEPTGEELVRELAAFGLNRPVGQSVEYSNLNYIILGQIVEALSGLPYARYVEQNIFEPLEMQHSYLSDSEAAARLDGLSEGYRYYFGLPVAVDLAEPQGSQAAGFHMSSADDMARYLIAFTEHGRHGGVSVVNPDGQPQPEDERAHYNINWLDLREAPPQGNTEAHSGGWLNYSAGIAFMPYGRVGVVALANSFPAQFWPVKDAYAITYDVLRQFTGNPPAPLTPRLTTLYVIGDAMLLLGLAFVLYRFSTLRSWRQRLIEEGSRPRTWLLWLLADLLLPLLILLVWPVIMLASPGSIHYNPWWNWRRLAFAMPDLTIALFLMTAALLLVGVVKLVLWLAVRATLRAAQPVPTAA